MSPTLIGIIGIVVMIIVFLSRMPVAYVMAMIGYLGFTIIISGQGGLALLSRNIYEVFSSYGLTTIPLFVFMGQLAFNAGISSRLYDTSTASPGPRSPEAIRLGLRLDIPVRGSNRRVDFTS